MPTNLDILTFILIRNVLAVDNKSINIIRNGCYTKIQNVRISLPPSFYVIQLLKYSIFFAHAHV